MITLAGSVPLFGSLGGKQLTAMTFARSGAAWDDAGNQAPLNLALWSEQFDNATWAKTRSSVTANATNAPNGTLTADKIVEDTASGSHYVFRAAGTTGVVASMSVYIKAGERTKAFIGTDGGTVGVWFDLVSGTVGTKSANFRATITDVGNGWYRCTASIDSPASANFAIAPCIVDGGTSSYLGDGTSGIYIWGAQYEQSATASPYIPTTSTTMGAARYGGPIPEPTTNLALFSEDYGNAYWSKNVCVVTATPGAAPNGTSAYKLTELVTTASHCLIRAAMFVASTVYTVSFYAKAAERSLVWANFNNATIAYFDLGAGTVASQAGNITAAGIDPIGGGWYRCWLTRSVADTGTQFNIGVAIATTGTQYAGTVGAGAYFWGVQVEQRATVTPYTGASGAVPRVRSILAAEPSTNLVTWSDPTAIDATNFPFNDPGLVYTPGGVPGFSGSVYYPGDGVGRAAYKRATLTVGVAYTLSVFVKMDDGSAPVTASSGTNAPNDFSLIGEGSTGFTGGVNVVPVGNGVYRVSGTRTATLGTLQNWGVTKFGTQSSKGFKVSGYQLEATTSSTDYIPTTSAAASRAGVPYHNGIIIEESTTNLVTLSDPTAVDATNFPGGTTATTYTANGIPGFTGSIVYGDNTVQRYALKTFGFAASTTYTVSAFVKMDDGGVPSPGTGSTNDFRIALSGNNATSYTTTPLGGGVYRVSGPTTTPASVVNNNLGIVKDTTNSAKGFKVSGYQLEAKAYPTGYVPTAGATVTRNAETLTVPTAGLLLPAAGTVIASVFVSGDMTGTPVGTHTIVDVGASANVNRVLLYQAAGNAGIRFLVGDSGGASVIAANTTPLTSGRHIFGGRWGPVDTAVWKDGVLAGTQLSKIPTSLATPVRIGTSFAGTSQWDDAIAWVAFYDRALTDGEMAAATNGSLPANYTAFYDFSKPTLAGVGHIRNMVYDDQQFGSIGLAPNSIG